MNCFCYDWYLTNIIFIYIYQGSVVSAWISGDGHYAFVEFRTIEECNAALTYLNGLQIGSYQLRVGRPKSFGGASVQPALMGIGGMQNAASLLSGATLGATPNLSAGAAGLGSLGSMLGVGAPPGLPSTAAAGMNNPMLAMAMGSSLVSSNVLMMSGLPLIIGEAQVKELLSPFGQV